MEDLVDFRIADARYLRQPAFRTYMAERKDVPRDLFDYLGYALIVGRK